MIYNVNNDYDYVYNNKLTRKGFLRSIVAFVCSNDETKLRKLMLLQHCTKSLKCDNILYVVFMDTSKTETA